MILTPDEATFILSEPKHTARPMEWETKPKRSVVEWFHYFSACWIQSEIHEGLYFRCNWRDGHFDTTKQSGSIFPWQPPNISAGIYLGNITLIRVDFADTFHKNKAGTGLPWAGKRIPCPHIHKWNAEDSRYAEPLTISLTANPLEAIIQQVCQVGNLTITGGFVPPPPQQLPLI